MCVQIIILSQIGNQYTDVTQGNKRNIREYYLKIF